MNALTAKITVSLVMLFGLGVATGYVIGRRPSPVMSLPPAPVAGITNRVPLPPPGPALMAAKRWRDERIGELKGSLKLSSNQVAAIEQRFDEMNEDFRDVQMETRMKMNRLMMNMNQVIARELTTEQRQQFWRQIRERMERAERARPGSE